MRSDHVRPRAPDIRKGATSMTQYAAADNPPTETPADTPVESPSPVDLLLQDLIRWANEMLDQEDRDADAAMPPDLTNH